MDFWDTFWATMWGALGGAIVGALTAWLFSLDLRRRAREDRAQEREQDRLDREDERALDREARHAEREEQRDWEYDERIRREWPRVIEATRQFANASRAVYDAMRTNQSVGNGFEQYRIALVSLTQRLFEAATIAKDAEHRVVNAIGGLTATTPAYSNVQIRSMDRIVDALAMYTTASPTRRASAIFTLESTLRELVATAQRETAEFLAGEGLGVPDR